jgi:hypothetical protein
MRTLPGTELVPTLFTGVYPHQNRIFQVSLKNDRHWSLTNHFSILLPDFVSVFWQCLYSMLDKKYELPTITWRRRRQFNFHRLKQKEVNFLLLVDNGQESVKGTINLKKSFESNGIRKEEYLYCMELSCARLWFKTDRARQKILKMLDGIEHITVLDYRQSYQYKICLDDKTFGEIFIFPDPGFIFFRMIPIIPWQTSFWLYPIVSCDRGFSIPAIEVIWLFA